MITKRIISLMLACIMIFSSFTGVYAASAVTDVENTKYESAVESLEILGIINGYEDGSFRPENEITRAEMAKLLVVSIGLEAAAKVSKGNTRFSDVNETHWASGYINVAAEYNIINGYPDGTFAPDAPVQYSEATTMAVRALGYKSVVEAKGTWPINYIAKAEELKILDGIEYDNYADNAIRGDVALLLWNALVIPTWGIIGESDGDGLSYGPSKTLIAQHFENYIYVDKDLRITDVQIQEGKVFISLNGEDTLIELEDDAEFLNIMGRTVSVLYDIKADKIVQLTLSTKDKVVEGYRNELIQDDYDFSKLVAEKVWGKAEKDFLDYIVAIVNDKNEVLYTTRYCLTEDIIVKELKVKENTTRINTNELVIDNDAIVLVHGQKATTRHLMKNDIISTLEDGKLYIASRDIITGTFQEITKTPEEEYIVIDRVKYDIPYDVTKIYEVDEDGEILKTETLNNILNNADSKYYGKDATLYLNFLGEIVKIEFQEIKEEKVESFYVLTDVPASYYEKGKMYVELNNTVYEVKAGVEVPTKNTSGDIVYVEFDKENRVSKIANILTSGDVFSDKYVIKTISNENGVLDEDAEKIGDYRITTDTLLIRPNAFVNKEDEVTGYWVEILSRPERYLEGVEYAAIAIESDDAFEDIAYVFVWEDTKNVDKDYGVADMYRKTNGKEYLEIDGIEYEIEEVELDFVNNIQSYEGRIVEFIENDTVKITLSFGTEDIRAARIVEEEYSLELDSDELKDKLVFEAQAEETLLDFYRFNSMEEIDADEITLEVGDRIVETEEIFLIIKVVED